MSGRVTSVFVYGTLQRGEEREQCWPLAPLSIAPAETLAELYDLGDYPAIIAGSNRIAGELWTFSASQIDDTLRVLDEIECCGQGGVDLYVRRVAKCRVADKQADAYTYFLADESLARANRRMACDSDGLCRWHRYR